MPQGGVDPFECQVNHWGPEPVLMTSWEHPASFTCPKHCRPSLITAHSGSRLRLAKMEIMCPQKTGDPAQLQRTGLPSGVVSTACDKRRLAGGTSSTFAAGPLTEIGVVEFNASGQRLAGIAFEHDLLDLVLDCPGGGLGHAEAAAKLDAGDALLALGHVIHRPEPETERQFGRLEDRSGDRRRLPTAGGALIKVSTSPRCAACRRRRDTRIRWAIGRRRPRPDIAPQHIPIAQPAH